MRGVARIALLTALLSLTTGTACLFASGGGEGAGAVTYPVKIDYWYSIGGAVKDTADTLIAKFNSSQDKYVIEGVFNGGYEDSMKKMLAAAVAKNLPALGHQANVYAPHLAQAGALQPLDEIMKADKTFKREDLVPALFNGNVFQGKVWGLPFNNSTGILYLNRDAFRQAGVSPDKFPEKWTEFREMLKVLKAKLPGDVVPYNLRPGSGWIPQAYLFTFGGAFLSEDNKTAPWDTKEFLECLTFFQGLKKDGLMIWNASADGYYAGKQAITTESTAVLTTYLKRVNFDLGTAPIPIATTKKAVIGGGSLYMFANKTRGEQEAAWAFMRYMTSKESQVAWSNGTGYLACNMAAVEELTQTTHKTDPRYAVAFRQMFYSVTENGTFAPTFDAVRNVFNEAWQRVMINDEDPKKVLVESEQKANKIIKEF
jgi:sn-glycerol 3-phosphate transport system substrate-binding protein